MMLNCIDTADLMWANVCVLAWLLRRSCRLLEAGQYPKVLVDISVYLLQTFALLSPSWTAWC